MGLFVCAMAPKTAPPKVPESVLKKRKTLEKIKADRLAKALAIKKTSKVARKAIFKKAEQYVKEYKNMEKALINSRRQAKQFGNYFVEPEPKLLFVTRIRGINKMPPQPRKILDLLRLRQIHNGVPQEQQGDYEHAPHCAVLHHVRRAQSQDRARARLQARLRQGQQAAPPADGQLRHRGCARQVRHRLHRGPHP